MKSGFFYLISCGTMEFQKVMKEPAGSSFGEHEVAASDPVIEAM